MRKLILLAQISLDGFVAGPDGKFDNFIDDDENLAFVCSLTEKADAAMFGRISYQLLDSYWPTAAQLPAASESIINYSNWYNSVPKFVLSNTLVSAPHNKTTILNANAAAEIINLKKMPGKDILLFGSPTVFHFLLEHNLIDGCWILLHPVIFGQGIPLFKNSNKKNKLVRTSTKLFANGMIGINYTLQKEE